MATLTDTLSKYGATVAAPVSVSNSSLPDLSKYGATVSTPTAQPSSSVATDWFGIKNPDTYFKDSLTQAANLIMHPIQTAENVVGVAGGAVVDAVKTAFQANKTAFGGINSTDPWAVKTANLLHSVGADAAVLFSPISAAFAAAAQVPVLKQAADVIQAPFAVTGKIGDFAAESFIKVLPIDQASKDVLAPAFGEIGSLAGQILLGGKIMDMVSKGVMPDKQMIDAVVEQTKAEVETAKEHAQSPEMVTQKYGATMTERDQNFNGPMNEPNAGGNGLHDSTPIEPTILYRGGDRIDSSKMTDEGISFSTSKEVADRFTSEKPNNSTNQYYLDPVAKVLKFSDVPKEFQNDIDAFKYAKDNGYDALVTDGFQKETRVFNPNVIKDIPSEQAPLSSEGTTPSGLGQSIEAKAIEANLTQKLDKVAGYDASTIKEQAKIFNDTLTSKGIDEMRAIVRGDRPLPEGQKPFPFIVAMEDYLKNHPNPELAYELANSPHVTSASEAASQLGLGQNRVQDSFTKKVEEIKKVRGAKSEVKTNAVKSEGAKELNKINLSEKELGKLESFIDSITC